MKVMTINLKATVKEVWFDRHVFDLVTDEKLPYWHLKHEVLLTEAEANICDSAVEKAGGPQYQDQVKVARKGYLKNNKLWDYQIIF